MILKSPELFVGVNWLVGFLWKSLPNRKTIRKFILMFMSMAKKLWMLH